jgi:hypothetical protein
VLPPAVVTFRYVTIHNTFHATSSFLHTRYIRGFLKLPHIFCPTFIASPYLYIHSSLSTHILSYLYLHTFPSHYFLSYNITPRMLLSTYRAVCYDAQLYSGPLSCTLYDLATEERTNRNKEHQNMKYNQPTHSLNETDPI